MNLGHLYVISAPSGTGKTSLVKALIERDPSIRLSVSTTTREPRAGEVHGKDYFFVKKEDFDKQINDNEFLEWAFVYGNFYGTSATLVKNSINSGQKILLEDGSYTYDCAAEPVTLKRWFRADKFYALRPSYRPIPSGMKLFCVDIVKGFPYDSKNLKTIYDPFNNEKNFNHRWNWLSW